MVAELQAREPACSHRISPVRTLLENQRDNLLLIAAQGGLTFSERQPGLGEERTDQLGLLTQTTDRKVELLV